MGLSALIVSTHARTTPAMMASEFGLPLTVTRSGKPWTRDVVQVRIAYFRVFILPIHGIDGLGQLYVASLVDAVSVDLQPLVSVLLSLFAALEVLSITTMLVTFISLLPIHIANLIISS